MICLNTLCNVVSIPVSANALTGLQMAALQAVELVAELSHVNTTQNLRRRLDEWSHANCTITKTALGRNATVQLDVQLTSCSRSDSVDDLAAEEGSQIVNDLDVGIVCGTVLRYTVPLSNEPRSERPATRHPGSRLAAEPAPLCTPIPRQAGESTSSGYLNTKLNVNKRDRI